MAKGWIVCGVVMAAFATRVRPQTPSFRSFPHVPGEYAATHPRAVSSDGTVVVGARNKTGSGWEAFLWMASEGMLSLGDLPGGEDKSFGLAVSGDGLVAAGWSFSQDGAPGEAFRWTRSEGMVGLGPQPGGIFFRDARGISGDGSVIVGNGAIRWTEAGGAQIIGSGEALGVSADGSIVVGGGDFATLQEAFRWTSETGMVSLGALDGDWRSFAHAVSDDGLVVVGESGSASRMQAFRWTESQGMVGIGDLPGGDVKSVAHGTSFDGSVVVGYGTCADGTEAFVWDSTNGMRTIADVLQVDCGLDLDGWVLREAYGVSDDGMTIVGYGTSPTGLDEGWIATVPEPATLALLALGGLALIRRRR